MKAMLVDKFPDSAVARIRELGVELSCNPELKGDAFLDEVRKFQPEVLLVRSTKVSAPVMESAEALKLIIRAGSGVDNIDINAASRRGIYVSNCPGKNATAVAELTLGLLLALDRRIPDNVAQLRDKKWNKKDFSKARGLYGRTFGVIGAGTIGKLVIERAKAFGMKVVAWSHPFTDEEAKALGVERMARPEDVAAVSDAVSVHVALVPETRGFCGKAFFDAMKPGAYFLNTSRGEVVDAAALKDAIKSKNIRAGLDVFAKEPAQAQAPFEDDVVDSANVYGTHHIGASTDQAQEATSDEAVRILRVFMATGTVANVVNVADKTPATHTLVVRHYDRVGVLAHVLDVLRRASINVQDMQNVIFQGAEAAVARIQLEAAPADAAVADIRKNADILEVSVIRAGA